MICMQYPTGPGRSYLTTELADALMAQGHQVEVLLLDWAGSPGGPEHAQITETGVRVVRCGAHAVTGLGRTVQGASKFLLSGWALAQTARRRMRLEAFDAAIAWAPLSAVAPLVPLLGKAGIEHRLLFIWDVFPDHHHEIGRIPGGLPLRLARALEQRLMDAFTTLFCTLPGNAAYLRRRWRVKPGQSVRVTPIWSDVTPPPPADRAAVRAQHGLPLDRPIAVFGGQLTEGRGFEQMLAAAEEGQAAGSPLLYLFVGHGRLAPHVRAKALAQPNLAWRPALARDEYLQLLCACDVGLVATVPGVTSFSIPSKTLDYLRAGLPVAAAVEHGNDYAAILERYGVGRAVPFRDASAFRREAEHLATDPAARARARQGAPLCLDEVFDVRHAVRAVLEAISA